jgi:EmrB/QacA subfamily drug resistance transporter
VERSPTLAGVNSRQRWTMVAAVLGSSIVFLDGTIVNVALPAIGQSLPHSIFSVLEGQTYVTSGYLATLAALLILAGALSDFYGRRRVFAIGLTGFLVTSIVCGLSPSLELLVVFRVLQGAAGALLVPCSLSIITATFDGPERGRAFGIWAAATSATSVLGPTIGGLLIQAISWRVAFLINVPLLVIALYATLKYVTESRDENATGRFDWLGAVVIALAVGGLAFGAIRGQAQQWRDPVSFAALIVGAIALVAFPILMVKRANPLIPLGLFRVRAFATINLSTLLIYGALYVTFGFQSLFLQGTLGYAAFAAGAVGLPTGLMLTFLSTRIGSLAGRLGGRPFLTAGPLVMAAGLLWLGRIPSTSAAWTSGPIPPVDYWIDIFPGIILFGLGISMVVAPLTSTLMSSVPVSNAGIASAINNAISRVGQPLLSAVIFIVITASFYGSLAAKVPGLDPNDPTLRAAVQPLNQPVAGTPPAIVAAAREASTDAYREAVFVGAILLIGGAVVNFVGLRPAAPANRRAGAGSAADREAAPDAAVEANAPPG